MADPTPYVPGYSYSGWQATNPSKPLPAPQVDNDFANVSRAIREVISALQDVRRSDGALANQSVGPDQLSPALSLGFTLRGAWADGTLYSAGDGIVFDNVFYAARVQHEADPANAPPNSAYWSYLFSVDDLVVSGALSLPLDTFTGDGVRTEFDLSFTPVSDRNVWARVGNLLQAVSAYTVSGTTLRFLTPPQAGYEVEVRGLGTTAALVEPTDGSVTKDKMATALFQLLASGVRFDSYAEFTAASIDASVDLVVVNGYYTPGDGGHHQLKRLASAPGTVKPWHGQSADGAWWQKLPVSEAFNGRMFGAKGDGATDDTAAWQAACDAAETLNVRNVFGVPGTYMIDGMFAGDNVHLDGTWACLFRLRPTAPIGASLFTNKDWVNGNTNVWARNCSWDGNRANRADPTGGPRPGYSCIVLANVIFGGVEGNYCTGGVLHAINLSSHTEAALGNGSSPSHWYSTGAKYCTVRGNYATNCGDDGITTHYTVGCLIEGNYVWDIGGSGGGDDLASDNTNGIEVDDGSRDTTVIGNFCWNTAPYVDVNGQRLMRDGIQAKGHDDTPAPQGTKIIGNHVWNTHRGIHAWHRGYSDSVLSPSAKDIIVEGNQVRDTLSDGIRMSRYEDISVVGNSVKNAGANPFIFTLGARNISTTGNIAKDCVNATYAYNYTDTCLGSVTHTGNEHDNCPRAIRVANKATVVGNRGNCRGLLVGSSGIFIPAGTDEFTVIGNNIEGATFPILNQAGFGVRKICELNVGLDQPKYRLLYASAVPLTLTGSTAETTVLTLTGIVPANAMGPNGRLRVTHLVSCAVNDASVKTGRLKINGTTVDTAVLTSNRAQRKQVEVANRNSATAQIAPGPTHASSFAASAAAVATYAFDTTVGLDITYTIQNGANGDSTTLESIMIEVMHAP